MKKIRLLLLFIFAISIFCCLPNNKNQVFAQESNFIKISSFSDSNFKLNDGKYDKKYKLTNDIIYENSNTTISNIFVGELDGNGKTITFKASPMAIFNTIGQGAKIYNLKIEFVSSQSFDFDMNSSNCGLFANSVDGAEIFGISFKNVNLNLNQTTSNNASEINFGLIAGKISKSNINQIKVEDSFIQSTNIKSHLNFGFLCGNSIDGSNINNCQLNNNNFDIKVNDNQNNKNVNFGFIAGQMGSGFITNNVVDCVLTSKLTLSNTLSNINLGYLLGLSTMQDLSIYSNIVSIQNNVILPQNINANLGSAVGKVEKEILTENLYGFLTTAKINFIGYCGFTQNLDYLAIKFEKLEDALTIQSKMQKSENWIFSHKFNFDTIWKFSTNQDLPNLQFFESFDIIFSEDKSLLSLGLQNLPQMPQTSTEKVVNNTEFKQTTKVNYNSKITISVFVTKENNYNKFFSISGLRLNSNLIYDIATKNSHGFKIDYKTENKNNNIVHIFEIDGINDMLDGEYSVLLSRNEFDMKIQVLNVKEDETVILKPGKVRYSSGVDSAYNISNIKLRYGEKYSFETSNVNSDYSNLADWYLKNESENYGSYDIYQNYSYEELNNITTAFTGMNKLEFIFNEACPLFKSESGDTNSYLNFEEYSNSNVFFAYVLFSRDVKNIEVTFQLENGDQITDKIVEIAIDGESVSVNFVDGKFIAKMRYDDKSHDIQLKTISSTYKFEAWKYSNNNTLTPFGDNGASFEIPKDDDSSTLNIIGVFSKNVASKTNDLTWLWCVLGLVGLLLVVLIVIVIIKKKKGDKSYRKYMY